MKLKLDENGHAVLADGKVVYVDDAEKEFQFDGAHLYNRVRELTNENTKHRERAESAETKLKAFDGFDTEAARKALETVKSLDQSKLIEAGKVEEIKAAVIKSMEEKFAPVVQERDRLVSVLHSEKIGGEFARSKFITEKLAIPADMVQAAFGRYFELKDDKLVAKDANGNPIYSDTKVGELAGFDEALQKIVETYPHRDSILKANGNSGGGAAGVNGAGSTRVITRKQFDAMPSAEQQKHAMAAGKGEIRITD